MSGQLLCANDSATTSTLLHSPTNPRCATCTTFGNPNETPRNLVVCIDGTANKFGRNNTNVVKLLEAVDCDNKNPKQFVYYSSGIGTRPKTSNWFKRMGKAVADKLDMAIAWNTREILEDAYAWLAGKYQEGDQIYLFGFSRGAYQVRVLAWMIYEVGLIKNPTDKQVGTAYDHFDHVRSSRLGAGGLARQFKTTFSWNNTRVHFIGVWDTVSSVGFGRGDDCLSASSAAAHACHIRHALALDEYRVKFMPEYFFEMNSPDLQKPTRNVQAMCCNVDTAKAAHAMGANDYTKIRNEDITLVDRDGATASEAQPAVINTGPCTHSSCGRHTDQKTADIKEVWFAGSHSDVGGKNRPGNSFHAGKVSLAWMRQEACTNGLILKPVNILWTAKDINCGTTDSMSFLWRLAEIFPVTHQVSFRGAGRNGWRLHLFEPRRIIPGQKIHASVQFANTYIPKGTFGNGFGNPLETTRPIPSKQDDIWEKGVIGHTAYATLFDRLREGVGDASCYLHKLLFMLRFADGPSPIKEEPEWLGILSDLITKPSDLVRLVAIAAYFEAMNPPDLEKTFPEGVFLEAEKSLVRLISPDERYLARVVALLRPFAKHKELRDSILTTDVINAFLQVVDHTISVQGEGFAEVMDALSSLVELHPDSKSMINRLAGFSDETKDKLSLMLHVKSPHHLTAVLRVVICLAKKDPLCCRKVVPRLHELAKEREKSFRLLAIQALAEILHSDVPQKRRLFHSPRRAESYASHVRSLPAGMIIDASLDQPPNAEPLQSHTTLIEDLLILADGRHTQARTGATFTLLKLCEDDNVQGYLLKKGLLDIFVRQLQFKDSALLAAYALTKCLSHKIFSAPISEDQDLAGYIVNMIRLDYFDEAIGLIEGFDILRDLLRCDGLKLQVLKYDIVTLLERKLGAGKPAKTRTGLIYLDIFWIHCGDSLTRRLVERGMSHLGTGRWKSQRAGVTILCALAQTWFGVKALQQAVPDVVNMILPRRDSNGQQAAVVPHTSPLRASSLFGPAFVLRVLAENETLRGEIRRTEQFGRLKLLYLFGNLRGILGEETPVWWSKSPTRDDVLDVISHMIRSMDSANCSTTFRFILPSIRHWDRITSRLRDGIVAAIGIPIIVSGVASAFVVGAITGSLELIFRTTSEAARRRWHLRRQNEIIQSLRMPRFNSLSFPPQIVMSGDWSPDVAFGDVWLESWQYVQEQAELLDGPDRRDPNATNQDTWLVL